MKVTKRQLEAMIRESVNQQVGTLNEEELEELLGGLKGLAGAAGAGFKKAGQAVAGVAQRAGNAVAGAAQTAGNAVAGAARGAGRAVSGAADRATGAIQGAAAGAAGAVKGAYQAGEQKSAIQAVDKGIKSTVAAADKAIQMAGTDQNLINALDNIKGIVAHAGEQMKNDKLAEGKASGPVRKKKTK